MKLGQEILYLSNADIEACDLSLAEVEAAVSTFAATHFANAARVVGLHMRGGIPGADNRWVNAFGRGPASLHAFERNARRCASAVALNESASASTSSSIKRTSIS